MKSLRLTVTGLGLAFGMMRALACPAATAQLDATPEQEKHFSRAEVTRIITDARKIVTGKGVEELLKIPIGGTQQWISVRGRDGANPILLMIHGGPASPDIPISWYFQSGWEDYFTVVQWDQRGSGKTYNANDAKLIQPTLSPARIAQDAAEVVQYLRSRYGKEKIFVLGHSWGSLVGLTLARERPEWLYAYIGMGQMVNAVAGERAGYEQALRDAQAAGDVQAVSELRSIAPYPEPDGRVPLEKINKERKWSVIYGGLTWGRSDLDYYYNLTQLSPDYTEDDIAAIGKGSQLSLGPLLPYMLSFDYSHVTQWKCPIIIFAGRHDSTTPSSIVAEWFARLHAPAKKFVWFENSAHMMMIEEPGRVLVHLVEDVRPLAN